MQIKLMFQLSTSTQAGSRQEPATRAGTGGGGGGGGGFDNGHYIAILYISDSQINDFLQICRHSEDNLRFV